MKPSSRKQKLAGRKQSAGNLKQECTRAWANGKKKAHSTSDPESMSLVQSMAVVPMRI